MVRNVTVYLDDNELETNDGAMRCASIAYENTEGKEEIRNDLVDSSGFWNMDDLIREVAGVLQVRPDAVMISG